jgi:gp32-like DNA binding protein
MAKTFKRTFKPLNTDRVKASATRSNSKFDSMYKSNAKVLKLKNGVNTLRVVRGSDNDYWGETVWVHSYVGAKESTYLCPKKMGKSKTCPICNAADDAAAAGDKDEASKLSARERTIAYVINRDDEKEGLQIWDQSFSGAQKLDAICTTKRGFLDISNPETGFDISVMRHGQGLNTRYTGEQVDRESSPLSEDARQQDAWIDEVDKAPLTSLLKYYPEEYLNDILTGKAREKDEDEEADEDAKPSRRSRRGEEEEDEEDTRPTQKTRARRGTRDEEEDDEEEGEAGEARRWKRSKANGRSEQEEDDDKPARRSRREEADDDEDEGTRPAKRTRARNDDEEDEEDEKPRSRSRREEPDDEDDEKPRGKRTRARDEDEEEEEAPRGRRRREEPDEEEEDEAPRRRAR